MAQLNENLVRAVFDEMVKHRPALAKYLVEDDDDLGGPVDHRILADLIIKHFPWPIGVELRRLFSGSMRQLDRLRLDQLFKTIERTMQFVSYVMLAQIWEEKRNGRLELGPSFTNEFPRRIGVLSLGNFTWLIRSMGTVGEGAGITWFMPEMGAVMNKKFYADLDFWVPERNEIGHYQINLTEEDIEKRCVEYEERLTRLLQALAFIVKYKLVTVREIRVQKSKHKEAQFAHVIDLLNSTDSDFKATELLHHVFSDSNAVLLMKDFKTPTEFLNLSPFVIDTRTETIDSKEKFSIKKDIFMYTKSSGDRLMYLGTEVTEKCDLTTLASYPALLEQFKSAMTDLGGEALAA
jgi:hypothetical protein